MKIILRFGRHNKITMVLKVKANIKVYNYVFKLSNENKITGKFIDKLIRHYI